MHYHVRAAALPKPGRYREMFELASRFHSGLLDRTRPLWEITLISGLPDRQIATFKTVHHALMDGAASIHFYNSLLSADPRERRAASPLSVADVKRVGRGQRWYGRLDLGGRRSMK